MNFVSFIACAARKGGVACCNEFNLRWCLVHDAACDPAVNEAQADPFKRQVLEAITCAGGDRLQKWHQLRFRLWLWLACAVRKSVDKQLTLEHHTV